MPMTKTEGEFLTTGKHKNAVLNLKNGFQLFAFFRRIFDNSSFYPVKDIDTWINFQLEMNIHPLVRKSMLVTSLKMTGNESQCSAPGNQFLPRA